MIPATPRSERNTETRVDKHFTSWPAKGGPGYEYLGDWSKRSVPKETDVALRT